MIADLIAPLLLSATIAASWNRFQLIFTEASDQVLLRSPATALAGTFSLSAAGLALSDYDLGSGGLLVALGIALAALVGRHRPGFIAETALPLLSLLLYLRLE